VVNLPPNRPYSFLRECHDFTSQRAEAVDSGRPYLAKKLVSRSEPDNDSRKSSPHILDGSPTPTVTQIKRESTFQSSKKRDLPLQLVMSAVGNVSFSFIHQSLSQSGNNEAKENPSRSPICPTILMPSHSVVQVAIPISTSLVANFTSFHSFTPLSCSCVPSIGVRVAQRSTMSRVTAEQHFRRTCFVASRARISHATKQWHVPKVK